MEKNEEKIDLKIGRDEALVLFEMLHDFYEQSALRIDLPAERLALVRLHGVLESQLVEPFMPDYSVLLENARSRLGRQFGDL
jgi:hypothetical protein